MLAFDKIGRSAKVPPLEPYSGVWFPGQNLSAVPQPRSHPVDSKLYGARHCVCGITGSITSQQFYLQMIKWIDVGCAVPDASAKRRIVLKQLRSPGHGE